jgi:hypothetical protein
MTPEDLLAQQLDEQSRADAEFRDLQAQMNDRVKQQFSRPQPTGTYQQAQQIQQMGPESQQLIQTLLANPILVPHVNRYAQGLVAKIAASVQSILQAEAPQEDHDTNT